MPIFDRFFAGGSWHPCTGNIRHPLLDPVTEESSGEVRFASDADLGHAVEAARAGLLSWAGSSLRDRRNALERLESAIQSRSEAFVEALRLDIGCPVSSGRFMQVDMPINNLRAMGEGIDAIEWETTIRHTTVRRVPVGVVAGFTPWNAPVHQIVAKVAGVIGAGGAIVLKPSEVAPNSAQLLAEAIDEINLPDGVFNLVWGGAEIGQKLVEHPGIHMVSFTGSDAVGRLVMASAALAPKPVALELGGKSAAIVLRDADFTTAVSAVFHRTLLNSGQVCVRQSRLIVPRERMDEAAAVIRESAQSVKLGDPIHPATTLGPLATRSQFERVTAVIRRANGRDGHSVLESGQFALPRRGFYVAPTVFTDVEPTSELAQREVFGPVLAILPYDTTEQAVEIANSTPYGLSGAVWSRDLEAADAVARQLRSGQAYVNAAPGNLAAPFGGFGQSGFGRENGRFGIQEFTVYQAIHKPPIG